MSSSGPTQNCEAEPMLISATSDKVNPVIMNRAITNGVLADIKDGNRRPDALAVLTLMRLLEMYAADRFESNPHVGLLEQEEFEDFNVLDDSSSNDALRKAMEATRKALGVTREEFVATFQPLLAHFSEENEQAGIDLDPENLAVMEQFLSMLSKALDTR